MELRRRQIDPGRRIDRVAVQRRLSDQNWFDVMGSRYIQEPDEPSFVCREVRRVIRQSALDGVLVNRTMRQRIEIDFAVALAGQMRSCGALPMPFQRATCG